MIRSLLVTETCRTLRISAVAAIAALPLTGGSAFAAPQEGPPVEVRISAASACARTQCVRVISSRCQLTVCRYRLAFRFRSVARVAAVGAGVGHPVVLHMPPAAAEEFIVIPQRARRLILRITDEAQVVRPRLARTEIRWYRVDSLWDGRKLVQGRLRVQFRKFSGSHHVIFRITTRGGGAITRHRFVSKHDETAFIELPAGTRPEGASFSVSSTSGRRQFMPEGPFEINFDGPR